MKKFSLRTLVPPQSRAGGRKNQVYTIEECTTPPVKGRKKVWRVIHESTDAYDMVAMKNNMQDRVKANKDPVTANEIKPWQAGVQHYRYRVGVYQKVGYLGD